MKKTLLTLAASGIVFAAGCSNGDAQEEQESEPAVPVEIYACNYNEGQGPADLDAATAKWNAWADARGLNDYTAWTGTPFYFGSEQEFDFLWLGVSPDATSMGRAQDDWIANGGEINAEFVRVANCNGHSNFAAVEFKEPPEREDPSTVNLSFSDCTIGDGKNFSDDVAPAISAWAEYRTGTGSDAGMWVLFPAYGGGGEEFDFKFVISHATYENLGVDYDEYGRAGRFKARELFPDGLLECDSSRSYNLVNRRMAADEEE